MQRFQGGQGWRAREWVSGCERDEDGRLRLRSG